MIEVGDTVRVRGNSNSDYQGIGVVTETDHGLITVRSTWDERTGEEDFPFLPERVTLISRPLLTAGVSTTKLTNPKDAVGSDKLPIHLWPETATLFGSLGLLEGMLKYGRSNWRESGVRASIYIDAARRHLAAWFEGEDCAPDSGLPHLAHALACLAILVDAQAAGELNDDRQYPGGYHALVDELTPHVARLKTKYADKSPRHWTRNDA